jgi:hypothetical protein
MPKSSSKTAAEVKAAGLLLLLLRPLAAPAHYGREKKYVPTRVKNIPASRTRGI